MWWFSEKIKEVNKVKIALVYLILVVGKVIAYRGDLSLLWYDDLYEVMVQLPFLALLAGVISQKIFRAIFKERKGRHDKHLVGFNLKEKEDKADDDALSFSIFWCLIGCLIFCF